MKNFFKKGLTLTEVLVVLAVLGIIVSVVLSQFSKIRENQVLKSGVQDILSSINKARSQTLASLNSFNYGVYFEPNRIVIFKGTGFEENVEGNEIIDIVTPATISSVALGCEPTIPCDIFFNRLSGSPSTNGTVTISTANYSKIITIWATGVASAN